MADAAVVHMGENSPEQVAYKLLKDVMQCEDYLLYDGGGRKADRKYLLDTYDECLRAVKLLR